MLVNAFARVRLSVGVDVYEEVVYEGSGLTAIGPLRDDSKEGGWEERQTARQSNERDAVPPSGEGLPSSRGVSKTARRVIKEGEHVEAFG